MVQWHLMLNGQTEQHLFMEGSRNIERFAFVAMILILISFLFNECKNTRNKDNIINSMNDTIIRKTNDLGQEVAIKKSYILQYSDMKRMLSTKDKEVFELNKRVTNLTKFRTVTKGKIQSNEVKVVIHQKDTTKTDQFAWNNQLLEDYPTYTSDYEDEWLKLKIKMSSETLDVLYEVNNEYVMKNEYISNGIFKPKDLSVVIKNLNPNTTTTDLQNYVIKGKKQNKGIILAAGFVGGVILSNLVR